MSTEQNKATTRRLLEEAWNKGNLGILDEYIAHVIAFLEAIGPGAHLIAVCQPCAHALAAVALMAEDDNPATPRSMTLMAGPVDTRINPTSVNTLATSRPIEWFEKALIASTSWSLNVTRSSR